MPKLLLCMCFSHNAPEEYLLHMESRENEQPKKSQPEWVWGLVGNIVDEHPYGQDKRIVRGTRHFKPGTKVYCLKTHWGDGYESIPVIGRNRKGKLIEIVMRGDLIENFRLKKVFSPSVIEMMSRYSYDDWYHGRQHWFEGWGNSDEDRREIEQYLRWLNLTEDEYEKYWLLFSFDELRLEMDFDNNPFSFCAVIRKKCRVKDQWVCHLNLGYRCDEDTWKTCPDKGFSFRCEEPERETVWEMLYSGSDGSRCSVGLLRAAHEYEQYIEELSSSLVDCKLHLLEPRYGQDARDSKSFSWSLAVIRGDTTIASEGKDCVPVGIWDLVRLLQVYGFPISQETLNAIDIQRDACCDVPLRAITDSR